MRTGATSIKTSRILRFNHFSFIFLAEQICSVAESLCKGLNLDIKSLVGGRTKRLMMNPTYQGVDLLVASFGAFSKLVSTGVYKINQVRHIVLDEADSLLDDSFIEKVSHLMTKIKVLYYFFTLCKLIKL